MRGESAHALLQGAPLVCLGQTEPGYALVVFDAYPALVRSARQDARVHGELYRVGDDLVGVLDDYEDHPTLYRRSAIRLAHGTVAQAYFGVAEEMLQAPRIPSGDWRQR